ncbi:free fatty acid receptor 4 [Geospiza fortis]|uniref:Free fatty acid receptor 4 n=1 Tax=Geospiza fortis TaxID=48883 RepID=A0A6I9Z8U6_GEOFO|nr:free fatty acid receptor 4 [Geospiza fortis]
MPVSGGTPGWNKTYFPFFSDFRGHNVVALRIGESCALVFIFLLSLAGNIWGICLLVRRHRRLCAANCLVLNLFCADLLFITAMPFIAVVRWTESWVLGNFVCHLLFYVVSLSGTVILLSLSAVSSSPGPGRGDRDSGRRGDRLRGGQRSVCRAGARLCPEERPELPRRLPGPLSRQTVPLGGKRASAEILFVFLDAAQRPPFQLTCPYRGISIPKDQHPGRAALQPQLPLYKMDIHICTLDWPSTAGETVWDTTFATVFFLIPGFIIVISYSKILQITKASRRRLNAGLAYPEHHQIRVSQQDYKLFRALFLLMISFFIMWTPIIIIFFLILIQNFKKDLNILPSVFFWIALFTFANSAVNPILYNVAYFRRKCQEIFLCCTGNPERHGAGTETTARRSKHEQPHLSFITR